MKVSQYNLRKSERNENIYHDYLARPDLSLQDIGNIYNVSRQRIYQIVVAQKIKGVFKG